MEFPVLAKVQALSGPIPPYIEGGVAFSRLLDIPDVIELTTGTLWSGPRRRHRTAPGIIRITPELRYNGWTSRKLHSPSARSNPTATRRRCCRYQFLNTTLK